MKDKKHYIIGDIHGEYQTLLANEKGNK